MIYVTQPQHTYGPDARLSTMQAAAYLGVSRATLGRWRRQGTGPRYVKLGRVYYVQADIDAWLHAAVQANPRRAFDIVHLVPVTQAHLAAERRAGFRVQAAAGVAPAPAPGP